MKKTMKRIGALVLAVMMMLGMMSVAFAAGATEIPSGENNMPGIGDIPNATNNGRTNDAYLAAENTVSINKGIVFINSETTDVYEPNITYTYTISSVTVPPGTTVTDEHPGTLAHSVVVYSGDSDYVSSTENPECKATVTFNDGNAFVSATAAGTQVTKPFTFTFVPTAFPHAGVYRFLITESVESSSANTRATAGIVQTSTYSATRYLDVYVRNDEDNPGDRQIYGYVLFEANGAGTNIDKDTTKSNGWVNTAASGSTADVDVYTTYNAVVSKTTTGSLADKTHSFPVTVTLTNADGCKTKIRVVANDNAAFGSGETTTWYGTQSDPSDTGTGTQPENAYVALTGTTAKVVGNNTANTFKDGGMLTFYGIPINTTINAKETNDTYDVYTATATVDDANTNATLSYIASSTASAATGTSASLERNGTATLKDVEQITAKKTIAFTNTISEISPTGYVVRFAPYALMLGAGIVLLLLTRRMKRDPDEA